MTNWKALIIQMESDEETCKSSEILGNATLQMVPSITARKRPAKVAIMA